jgi:hypothetical protein
MGKQSCHRLPGGGRCCEQSLAGGLLALVRGRRWAGSGSGGARTIEEKQKKNLAARTW